MRRKIRRNVFETNSSSSHNLTITTIGKEDYTLFDKKSGTLNIGVFYEKNKRTDYMVSDGDGWTASTRHEKAALLFLILMSTDDYHVSPYKHFIEYSQNILGYNKIYNPNNYYLPSYPDRGHFDIDIETLICSDGIQLENIKILDEFIEVINDDNKIITFIINSGS
jgi:hypothetical protein